MQTSEKRLSMKETLIWAHTKNRWCGSTAAGPQPRAADRSSVRSHAECTGRLRDASDRNPEKDAGGGAPESPSTAPPAPDGPKRQGLADTTMSSVFDGPAKFLLAIRR